MIKRSQVNKQSGVSIEQTGLSSTRSQWSQMNNGSQLNKESGVSIEQGVSAKQGVSGLK